MQEVCRQCSRKFSDGEKFCPFDGKRLTATVKTRQDKSDPLIGQVVDGRYLIEKRIGQGGMGTVYKAKHQMIRKPYAVKVLRNIDDSGNALARFRQEAKSASRLGHPNIVDVSDFGNTDDGLPFLVMEYLEGKTLADLIEESQVVSLDQGIPIIAQCLQALGSAHAAGIVHRDMKPENIFLTTHGNNNSFVKVLDFGLAKINDLDHGREPGRKLTKTGMIFGTPQYMSPEQCFGRPADHRADIYSMGLIMYEMFSGSVAFTAETFMGILNAHMREPVQRMREKNPQIQIPESLEAVIYQCLSKKPQDRPQSMGDVLEDIVSSLRRSGFSQTADTTLSNMQAIHGYVPLERTPQRAAKHSASVIPSTRVGDTMMDAAEQAKQVPVPLVKKQPSVTPQARRRQAPISRHPVQTGLRPVTTPTRTLPWWVWLLGGVALMAAGGGLAVLLLSLLE